MAVIQDCLWALRSLRRNVLLSMTVIICLAIGIGMATAVFSVVNGVLLRALPYPNADRIVMLRTANRANIGEDQGRLSAGEFRDWQAAAKSFESMAAYRWMTVDLLGPNSSERLQGLWVTPEFFRIFGIQASAGQLFSSNDGFGMVLGKGLWQRRFGLDPSIAGHSAAVGICCPQEPRTTRIPIAGAVGTEQVFPPTLQSIRDQGHGLNDFVDYWAPAGIENVPAGGPRSYEAVATLKPGASVAQAQAEMDGIGRRMAETDPQSNAGWTIRVVPIGDALFSSVRPVLLLLLGAAGFVLLIACSNVAVLLTFSGVGRMHEIAVRSALGAGSRRLVRQFLAQSMILTLCGSGAGLLLALAVKRVLIQLAPAGLPRLNQISLDWRVLLFAVAVAILCGVLVGLIPALRILRFDVESTLRSENSRNATSHRRARTCEPLLALQVALTAVLMVGSGLMIRSLDRLLAVSPGFHATNVTTVTLSLPSAKHAWSYNAEFADRVMERVKTLPGVAQAAYIRGVPLDGNEVRFYSPYWPVESPPADPSHPLQVRLRVVSRGYFATMGIPLEGKDFTRVDEFAGKIGTAKVVIINRALARLFWPGRSALGRKLNDGSEVIGVAGDVRYAAIENEPGPEVYLPAGLFPQDRFSLVVRASSGTGISAGIRSAIREIDPDVFISEFQTMDEVIGRSLLQRRFVMLLLSAFSLAGVILAVAGIAAIVAYSLSLRLREIGIRVAVGASPQKVVLLMARQGVAPAFAGLLLGIPAALALTRFLAHLLYGVSPRDPAVFASAIFILGAVSFLAACVSASRASRLDVCNLLR